MYLCNAGVGISSNGQVHVNFTDCNKRTLNDVANGTASLTLKDDASGAMQYTVAVVFVYSIAVLGVFGLGLYNRQKHRRNHVDNETRAFLKNYENVKRICEQKSRVGAIQALLQQIHNEPLSNCGDYSKSSASVNSLAFLPMSLSSLNEQFPLDNIIADESYVLTELRDNPTQDSIEQEHKVRSSPVRAKQTMLGSSRRSYSACRRCATGRGAMATPGSCPCKFYESFETDESDQLNEIVSLTKSEQSCERT